MTLDLSAALEQIAAMHDENMRLAEIDCEHCNHHALIVVRFDSPESVKCPKCGEVLDLLNEDEIVMEVETRKAAQQPVYDAASHAATIAARNTDAANPNPQYVSLPQLMGKATVYNDWETFTRAVDDTDCSGQWDDRGQDH